MTAQEAKGATQLSVVIPTCNRIADLGLCLQQVVPQAVAMGGSEVIVTDDGDFNRTRELLAEKFPTVIWTQGPRQGPAANRNHGAKIATGKWLMFLDDDLAPQDGLFESMGRAIANAPDADIFEGVILNDRPLPSLLWEAPFNDQECPQLSCSAAFCIRASTFREIEGFDERYRSGVYAEDMEFSARLLAIGARKKFVPGAVVIHPIRRRPGPTKLARRWEGMVVNARDQGASGFRILLNLPWHVFRVIQSRFRNQKWTVDNVRAAGLFARELLFVLYFTPGWVAKWSKSDQSKFWKAWVKQHGSAPKYGF